ncbi:hypothetical protein C0991_001110 [Blastosporella zonata]|nr:hypothetical protein C0991_001110 [Blastosporella zonata]
MNTSRPQSYCRVGPTRAFPAQVAQVECKLGDSDASIYNHEPNIKIANTHAQSHHPRASEKRITATTRQLESMIRLSEAHARMRFSEFVELQDCRLMERHGPPDRED